MRFQLGHLAVQLFAGGGAGGFFFRFGLGEHRTKAGEKQGGGQQKRGTL
ncbi:MAG: hypothetical protein NTZ16_09895 [Verrucomicrobia bacterium]|nr:hypothetical protein [Verrucomicrobiota bacterium]